jgi:toxin-antitoxin system PIN domain toxin
VAKAAVFLLDVNLLVALAWPQHVHHARAHAWFRKRPARRWASCPLTQLAFVRISSNPKIIAEAVAPREAVAMLKRITALPRHRFWADDVRPERETAFDALALVGHRQVTDAYLLALCMARPGRRLATLDRGVLELLADAAKRETYVELID